MTQYTYDYDGLVVKLIDAGADKPIKVFRKGSDNKIRESKIPDLHNVTVSLFVEKDSPFFGKIQTVDINLNYGQRTNIEGRAPYTLDDDFDSDPRNVDFLGGTLPLGSSTIQFTLNLKNGRQKTITRDFFIGYPDLKVGFFDADTDTLIRTLEEDSQNYIPAHLVDGKNVNVAAFVPEYSLFFGEVESMYLNLKSYSYHYDYTEVTRIENQEPYTIFGDINGDLNGGTISFGEHWIYFDVYSGNDLGGDYLGTVSRYFNVSS